MKELSNCKTSIKNAIEGNYFAIAHLYKEEKVMNMHIHDCYEVYYSVFGGKQFLIDNKFYSINPGDAFVINQYESHYISQVEKEVHERIVISIHPDFIKKISTKTTDLSDCFTKREKGFSHKISLDKEAQQRFLYYINKITSANGYGSDLIERTAFTELMLLLNNGYLVKHEEAAKMVSIKYNKQVDDIINYINQNLQEDISLEGISSQFYISTSYICRIFKSSTGMTINKYITARRISIAKSLLAEGLSVNEVCGQCGYNNYSNFVKAFTKTVGISPKKYANLSLS
ncbi:AraC family transcriptional regulator [Novisyntrophococcus fermenticellae]|uniref:AraC family transcriptional regulator n=1 Tax=Novisyntrophococcus fermenticellae TaxID=2068655 RepID=UPI001E34FBC7|nr:AraC family transcriptional regulator [Novisyntrophococcus fermenticellae]